ncbi:MAG: adenine phosphoribosyltransferase [Tyzzerella sp.]|uniref:Adenine phosphoribosyltransferase n=1 Tax=Candidatus Fimicola merdigallinarum TaxID=2840819 RepID=A0A9D9H423_9FIRM|nr:adenine phosphoribosyltransferase [Candidatus Fimicola merdigallinarum]
MDLKSKIRDIKDFPEKGIIFRDITTLLKDSEAMMYSVDEIIKNLNPDDFDIVIGPESRGFIFGMPVAYNLKKGFVPVRKKGKLPAKVISKDYALEYGTATIEIHEDAIKKGTRVAIIDDLLATGGTAKAIAELIEEMGGVVSSFNFLIELDDLKGRDVLSGYKVNSIIHY